jgi:hypothetical protein
MSLPHAISRIVPGDFAANPPLLALLAANLITIILAILENWDVASVLFIYWAQSIIIGIFTVITLLSVDTGALAADMGKSLAEHGGNPVVNKGYIWLYKGILVGFFTLHYGLFHYGYFSFIVISGIFGPVDFGSTGIWTACGLFFFNHLYSYSYHRGNEKRGAGFITAEFFRPYNRIIPMHLTIIFGSMVMLVFQFLGIESVMPVLVLFLGLKTWMDIRMHLRKHYEQAHPDEPVQLIGF